MNSGTPDSSSFSNIITLLIIRNELRYTGQQFILQYYNTTNNQEITQVLVYLSSFLIISGVIILENELLSGVPEFIPDY
jgi:hypothetical protein